MDSDNRKTIDFFNVKILMPLLKYLQKGNYKMTVIGAFPDVCQWDIFYLVLDIAAEVLKSNDSTAVWEAKKVLF